MQKSVHIITERLDISNPLHSLLERRGIAVTTGDIPQGVQTVVLGAGSNVAKTGTRAVLDALRPYKPRTVVIVTEDADEFSYETETGGRLIRVGIPETSAAPLHHTPLLTLANMIGETVGAMAAATPATGQLIALAQRVAQSDVTVFINGPTGSGKEVLSRFIHNASRRADKPFVALNCAAIPENMLEAMLFGHEKGAFTGASAGNKGIMRAADGGTLLLDEVSEMPAGLQSKLLRVLQERKVTPIGSQQEIPVDIRVIATSNRDMPAEVAARRFREDLFYRLNVFPLATKPLAQRPEDIPVLAALLAKRHCPAEMRLPMLTAEALKTLKAHHWPGNVRELENVIQRALVLCNGVTITPDNLIIDAGQSLDLPADHAPVHAL